MPGPDSRAAVLADVQAGSGLIWGRFAQREPPGASCQSFAQRNSGGTVFADRSAIRAATLTGLIQVYQSAARLFLAITRASSFDICRKAFSARGVRVSRLILPSRGSWALVIQPASSSSLNRE